MLDSLQLQQLTLKLLDKPVSESELSQLVRYYASLSSAYLINLSRSGKISFDVTNVNISEFHKLALDTIAELFARDEANYLTQLQNYFIPLKSMISESHVNALKMTRRLVVSHTYQATVKQRAQIDPNGAKIYRNLTLAAERDSAIKLVAYGDSKYFFLWEGETACDFPADLSPHLPEIQWDLSVHYLNQAKAQHNGIPGIVHDYLEQLRNDESVRHFIDRLELFYQLKHILGLRETILDEQIGRIHGKDDDFEKMPEATQTRFLHLVQKWVRNELAERYVKKDKLDEQEAQVVGQVLDQYLFDLVMDGSSQMLTIYRDESELKELSEVKWKQVRGILEYLIRLGRGYLQEQFSKEFLKNQSMVVEDE
ncbi:MAG: hypothetical protein HQ556_16365 [Candidatus Marinimicrobia bacterium]|nr:hypothetical protein [Candidatus Neomarinimicrobiota bacterium]